MADTAHPTVRDRLYLTIPLVPSSSPQGPTTGRLRFDVVPMPAWSQTPPPPSRDAPWPAPPGLSCLRREMARIEATLAAERVRQEHPRGFVPTQAIIIDDTPPARLLSGIPLQPGESYRFLYDWATCTAWPILHAPNPPEVGPDGRPGRSMVQEALRASSDRHPAGCGGMPGAFQGGFSVYAPCPPDPPAPPYSASDASLDDTNPDRTNIDSMPPPPPGAHPTTDATPEEDPSPFTYITGPPVRLLLPPRLNPTEMWNDGEPAPQAGPPPTANRRRRREYKSLSLAQRRKLASTYVAHLERADEELRSRMSKLNMGSIADVPDAEDDWPDSSSSDSGSSDSDRPSGLLGCAICLEPYAPDDNFVAKDGRKVEDQHVVAVGCRGFHTLHRGCLRDWLQNLPATAWTCPFCRDPLQPPAQQLAQLQLQAAAGQTEVDEGDEHEPIFGGMSDRNSLRAEVHRRERELRVRCDAPACFPVYGSDVKRLARSSLTRFKNENFPGLTKDSFISLVPCRHEFHDECLRTALRVEDPLVADTLERDAERRRAAVQRTDDDSESASESASESEEPPPTGRWVTCPACRHQAWVKLA